MQQKNDRRHRQALKTLGKNPLNSQIWEEYCKCMAQAQDTVEAKILSDIKDGEKKAIEKSWRYMGPLAGKDSTQELLDYDSGYPVQDTEEPPEKQFYILFGATDVKCFSENWKTQSRIIEDFPVSSSRGEFVKLVVRVEFRLNAETESRPRFRLSILAETESRLRC